MGREEPHLGREEPKKKNTACKLLPLTILENEPMSIQCEISAYIAELHFNHHLLFGVGFAGIKIHDERWVIQ